MLTEFDQSTIANMTAALDFVCKKIPTERDGTQLRKQIADEIIRCARSGRRTLGRSPGSGSQRFGGNSNVRAQELVRTGSLFSW